MRRLLLYTYYKHNKNGKYSTVVKHLDIGERFNGFEAVLAKLSPRRYEKPHKPVSHSVF